MKRKLISLSACLFLGLALVMPIKMHSVTVFAIETDSIQPRAMTCPYCGLNLFALADTTYTPWGFVKQTNCSHGYPRGYDELYNRSRTDVFTCRSCGYTEYLNSNESNTICFGKYQ